jgi:hypothetical protein
MLPQIHMFSTHVQKLLLAAECLMFRDVTPQSLTPTDLQAIRYYIQCLSEKFESSPPMSAPTNRIQTHTAV